MCQELGLKFCICCSLFWSGSIRHLFCTEILSHFSIFFLVRFYFPPPLFFSSSKPFAFEDKAAVYTVIFWSPPSSPWWGGKLLILCVGIICGTHGKENWSKINWLRENKNRTSHVTRKGCMQKKFPVLSAEHTEQN